MALQRQRDGACGGGGATRQHSWRRDGACGGGASACPAVSRRRLRRRRDGACGGDASALAAAARRRLWWRRVGDRGGGAMSLVATGASAFPAASRRRLRQRRDGACGSDAMAAATTAASNDQGDGNGDSDSAGGIVDIERAGLPLPSSSSAMAAAPSTTALQTLFGAGDGRRWRHGLCNHDGYYHLTPSYRGPPSDPWPHSFIHYLLEGQHTGPVMSGARRACVPAASTFFRVTRVGRAR